MLKRIAVIGFLVGIAILAHHSHGEAAPKAPPTTTTTQTTAPDPPPEETAPAAPTTAAKARVNLDKPNVNKPKKRGKETWPCKRTRVC